jgi:hypothetical protein
MESKKFTQHNIDEILSSIDGMSRAELSPFFYTRVQANLDKHSSLPGNFWSLVTRPAVSLATFSLLLVLNIVAINHFIKKDKQSVGGESGGIQGFAQEYDLTTTSVYNDKTTR